MTVVQLRDARADEAGFYLAMGAVRVGDIPSGSLPGRTLSLFEIRLAQSPATADDED